MADDDQPKGRPTRLRITSCMAVYTGTNQRGDQYTIHEVEAVKGDGSPVNEKLRSFENLPLEVLDLMVVPYRSQKHGLSYTLSRRSKPNTAARVKELEELVRDLLTRVEALEKKKGWNDPDLQPTFGDIPL